MDKYVVVEKAGMVGERDIATFDSASEAWAELERRYSDEERDSCSRSCLWPDVRCDPADGGDSWYGC